MNHRSGHTPKAEESELSEETEPPEELTKMQNSKDDIGSVFNLHTL